MLNCFIMTIFPDVINNFINHSMIKKSQSMINYKIINIRDFADPPHFKVDDSPFGGGDGMIFKPEPIFRAYDSIMKEVGSDKNVKFVFPTPDAELFNHDAALSISKTDNLIFLCGHYKGIDQRIRDSIITHEYSVGDFVLTGGELPTCLIIDSVIRLIPGVLNNYQSAATDSFFSGLLDGPHYTRPENYRDLKVPNVLLSGHHEKVEEWHNNMRKERTKKIRPDIWKKYKK